jgi:hypothetical protein
LLNEAWFPSCITDVAAAVSAITSAAANRILNTTPKSATSSPA